MRVLVGVAGAGLALPDGFCRRVISRTCALVAGAALAVSVLTHSVRAADLPEIESKALSYREWLPLPIYVDMEVHTMVVGRENESRISYQFWTDGVAKRNDERFWHRMKRHWLPPTRFLLTDREWMLAPARWSPKGEELSSSLGLNDGTQTSKKRIGDLRLLEIAGFGMSVGGVGEAVRTGLYSMLGRTDRVDQRASDEPDGRRRIDYRTKDGCDVSLWFDVERGPSLVSIRFVRPTRKERIEATVDNELAQFGNVWFPKTSTYELKANGKLVSREVATVNEATFADPCATYASLRVLPR